MQESHSHGCLVWELEARRWVGLTKDTEEDDDDDDDDDN